MGVTIKMNEQIDLKQLHKEIMQELENFKKVYKRGITRRKQ